MGGWGELGRGRSVSASIFQQFSNKNIFIVNISERKWLRNSIANPLPFPVIVGHAKEVRPKKYKSVMACKLHNRLPSRVIYLCNNQNALYLRFLCCVQILVILCRQFCPTTDYNDQWRSGKNWDSDLDLRSTYKVDLLRLNYKSFDAP